MHQLIMACFVLEMSARKVSTALLCLLRERTSGSVVRRVAESLHREEKRYRQRKLSEGYRFLFFDG
jgi:transposase-like protein